MLVKFVRWLCEKTKPKYDLINNPFAKAATPDDIIVAAVVQSIARDFDDWEYSQGIYQPYHGRLAARDSNNPANVWRDKWKNKAPSVNFYTVNRVLFHEKKNLIVVFREYDDFCSDSNHTDNYCVSGVSIPDALGRVIYESYNKIKTERARAKAKADAALAEMKRLEQAWNLAENLLGLKRNEFGALVPKESVDEK